MLSNKSKFINPFLKDGFCNTATRYRNFLRAFSSSNDSANFDVQGEYEKAAFQHLYNITLSRARLNRSISKIKKWYVVGAKSTEHGVYDRIDPLVFPLQYKESKFAVLLFSNPDYHKLFKINSTKILQIPTPLPYDPLIEVDEANLDHLFAQLPQTLKRESNTKIYIDITSPFEVKINKKQLSDLNSARRGLVVESLLSQKNANLPELQDADFVTVKKNGSLATLTIDAPEGHFTYIPAFSSNDLALLHTLSRVDRNEITIESIKWRQLIEFMNKAHFITGGISINLIKDAYSVDNRLGWGFLTKKGVLQNKTGERLPQIN